MSSEPKEQKQIQYGILPRDYYFLLQPMFNENGGELPDPSFSRIACAYFDDEIIGFYCLQLMQHAEPLWIKEEWRGRGAKIIPNLLRMIDLHRGKGKVFIVAENEESERMCLALGLKKLDFPVYVKED